MLGNKESLQGDTRVSPAKGNRSDLVEGLGGGEDEHTRVKVGSLMGRVEYLKK